MAKILKKPVKAISKPGKAASSKSSAQNITRAGTVAMSQDNLKESSRVKVFEIPVDLLDEYEGNPNEQVEKTFDELVHRLKTDGPDEPVLVVPTVIAGKPNGRYKITSGHHRKRAYIAAGFTTVDAIIREGWDEDRIAIEVITRNQLRGQLNPYKFTEMFDRLKKRYDPEQLKKMMGLTEKKAFSALYKSISANLNPKQKRKLDEAKETINSIEDLSSVLHTIFKEHGAELDFGFMVFNYGGKRHHYIKVDEDTDKLLRDIEEHFASKDEQCSATFANAIKRVHEELGL